MRTEKIVLSFVLLLLTLTSFAQKSSAVRYSISYNKEHYLLSKGDETLVLDITSEWPELLNGKVPVELQKALCLSAFGTESSDYIASRDSFRNTLGTLVKGQLLSAPDDDKFCYMDISIREIGLWPDRFATFEVVVQTSPASNSSYKEKYVSEFVVYDIINRCVVPNEDIIKLGTVSSSVYYSNQFIIGILLGDPDMVNTNDYENYLSAFNYLNYSVSDKVGIGNKCYLIKYSVQEQPDAEITEGADLDMSLFDNVSNSRMSYPLLSNMSDFVPRKLKKWLEMPVPFSPSDTLRKDSGICEDADVKASFAIPDMTLAKYMKERLLIPDEAKAESPVNRICASFIVESDGTVTHPRILVPSSPIVDRTFIQVLSSMPKWKPAMKNGLPVKSEVVCPISLRL